MSKVQKLLITIFSIVLALTAAFCIFSVISSNIPKLNPVQVEAAATEDVQDTSSSVSSSSLTYDNFSINGGIQSAKNSSGSTTSSNGDYLCESLSTKLITESDYNQLKAKANTASLPEDYAQMLINELYAKHGYIFKTDTILAYFNAKSWYHGTTSDMDTVFASMNSTEQANVNFLMNYTE